MLMEILLVTLVVVIVVCLALAFHYFHTKSKNETNGTIRAVVDEVNKSNMYSYNYEKQQGEYIKNIDHNMVVIDKQMASLKDKVNTLQVNAASKEDLRGIKTNIFRDLQVGDLKASSVTNGGTTFLNLQSKSAGPIGLQADTLNVGNNINLRGDLIIAEGAYVKKVGGGPIAETTDSGTKERFGIGKYPGSHTRVYSTNAVSLSKINGNGSFQDLLRADTNSINISKPFCLNDNICLVANGRELHVCPAYNPTITDPDCKQIV